MVCHRRWRSSPGNYLVGHGATATSQIRRPNAQHKSEQSNMSDTTYRPKGRLARNVLWLLSGNGLKLILQAAYFVLIARSLGPDLYGAFVAVVAIAAAISPFVGLGTSNLIVRNVARDKSLFNESWGNALLVTATTGLLGVVLVLFMRVLMPASIGGAILVLIASADLVFGRITDLCGFAFGAIERFGPTAHINVWISLSRVLGLAALVLFIPHPSVEQWAAVYLLTAIVTALISVFWALNALGRPILRIGRLRKELGEGFYYSIGLAAQSVYNDIDKTMIAKLGDLQATGIYGAAYRVIDVSLVPLRSVLSAANPGFFRAGGGGITESLAYMRPLLARAVLYATVIMLGLLLCAPLLPHVLGGGYESTASAVRWLSVLPLIKSVHLFLADALTGAGYQRMRSLVQTGIAIVNVLINLWIIPAYSWRGAAWSSIASDLLLAVTLGIATLYLARSHQATMRTVEETI